MRLIFLLILPLLTQLLLVKENCSILTESNQFIPSTQYVQKVKFTGLNFNNNTSIYIQKFWHLDVANAVYSPSVFKQQTHISIRFKLNHHQRSS